MQRSLVINYLLIENGNEITETTLLQISSKAIFLAGRRFVFSPCEQQIVQLEVTARLNSVVKEEQIYIPLREGLLDSSFCRFQYRARRIPFVLLGFANFDVQLDRQSDGSDHR